MRFFVRKAKISAEDRKFFEKFGTIGLQTLISSAATTKGGTSLDYYREGKQRNLAEDNNAMLEWLLEQHDIAERKETWSLLMEMAITTLVAIEVASGVFGISRSDVVKAFSKIWVLITSLQF